MKKEEKRKKQQKKQQREHQEREQAKRQIKQQEKRNWKEYVYNSPYLIAILVTSIVVMIASEEIGIRAIAKEVRTFAWEVQAKMPGKQEQVSSELVRTDPVKELAAVSENTDSGDDLEPVSVDDSENAGECRERNDALVTEAEQPVVDTVSGNAGKQDEIPIGITNYVYYDPVQIDSRYYKDAGKVALTTEYPYTNENISYFNDAAFLGDSRTLGISDYAGLEEADFYCDSGMMIFKLLEEGVTYQKTGDKVDLTSVLQEKTYGKIYMMLGMNELGYGNTELYLEKYREVIRQIREWQPEAVIYIMANLHVSREKNNLETEFNNININDKNAAAASLANGTDVFYLDANPLFTDEEGFLNAELTFDGVHLYAKHYAAWREFLLEHAVE